MRLRAVLLVVPALAAGAGAAIAADWSAPTALTPRDGASYGAVDVAVRDGRALVAWVRAPAGTRGRARTWVATRGSARARWSRPRPVSGSGTATPRVGLNARGDAVVAWTSGPRIVAATRRGPAGRWAAAPVAGTAAGVQGTRVAIDRRGRPTVLWSERDGDGFTVRVAARTSARAGWSSRPPRIATPGPDPPAIALSRGGALVAWTDDAGTRMARTASGMFERPRLVAEDTGPAAAGLSDGGVAVGAWGTVLPGGSPVVLAAGRGAGDTGWAVPEDLGIGLRPRVALNDRGDAAVVWRLDETGAPQGVAAATRRGGRGRWRASTVVPRRECACALRPEDVAVDGDGTALVGWRRDGEGGGGGAAALEPGAPGWQRARVSPHLDAAPAVAGDPSGGGVAAWVDGGPRGGVRVAALRP